MDRSSLSPAVVATKVVRRGRDSKFGAVRWAFGFGRTAFRFVGRCVPALHLGWVSQVNRVLWDGDDLLIGGWGYTRGFGYDAPPTTEVWLHRRWSPRRISATVTPSTDPDVVGAAVRAEHDYANTAFEARWDAKTLESLDSSGRFGTWRVRVQVRGGRRRYWGPVRRVSPFGSAAAMSLHRFASGALVGPLAHERRGLLVVRRRAAVVMRSVEASGREFVATIDQVVDGARLVSDSQPEVDLVVETSTEGSVLRGTVPPRSPAINPVSLRTIPATWRISVRQGRATRDVTVESDLWRRDPDGASSLLIRGDGQLRAEVIDVPVFIEVDTVALVDDATVSLAGRYVGDLDAAALALVGSRATLPVQVTHRDGDRFSAQVSLRIGHWGGREMAPIRGPYRLQATVDGETVATFVDPELARTLPVVHALPDYRLRFELDRRDLFRIQIGRARAPKEYGSFNQQRLQRVYFARSVEPQDSVFFESFNGRNATCNPRAIDREVAARYPTVKRYWAVDDRSIVVPDGAIPVVVGSIDWWEARSSSRWIVTNEWLHARFKKRSFQTVLQTWHGSMYKKIGLDRANMNASHYRLLKRERANWDMFVSQNAPGTEIIQHAYDFDRADVIEAGYPRNDELQHVTDAQRADVRRRLGVPDGVRLAMYAPTWRLPAGEGEEGLLDAARMAADLGPGWNLLLRGHVRTLANSDAVIERGIVDVGTYPQVSELFMVADVLITDYSSMMFDYSVTGKPMIFFAPDIDQYSDDDVRGAYFDLQKLAPGPVVLTQDEVRDLLLVDGLSWHSEYAKKYAAWIAMFNHADDGGASGRATDALFSRSAPAV